MTHTITITLDSPILSRKVDGKEITWDVTKLSNSMAARYFTYGGQRHHNDSFSGFQGDEKYRLVLESCENAANGAEYESGRNGTSKPKRAPHEALAIKTAKMDLAAVFAKRTGYAKAIDFANCDDGSVAKYYKVSDGKATWKDEEVLTFIEKRAESGKRDYIKEALETLEGADDDSDDDI